MMKLSIFILSLALIGVAFIPYIAGIIRGKIRPHPINWLAWAIITLVQALVLLYNGGGWATWVFGVMVLINLTVFVLGLRFAKKVTITTNDWVCFSAAIIALVFWLLIDSPELSVFVIVIAIFIGFIPALRKAYYHPYDESAFTWSINGLRCVLMIIIVTSYTFTTLFNQVFWAVVYIGAAVFLLIRRKQLKKIQDSAERKTNRADRTRANS